MVSNKDKVWFLELVVKAQKSKIEQALEICNDVLIKGYDIEDSDYDKGCYDIAQEIYEILKGDKNDNK